MDKLISLFGGSGFIGSKFIDGSKYFRISRNDYVPKSNKILYFISTVDNYNVHTDPFIDIETNLTTLIKVLENCKYKENIEFNFISSWFVYGDTELPANENSPCNPKGFYSITKRSAEQLLESYCTTFGIKYRIIRLANVLGTNDNKVSKKKNALQYLIKELVNNNEIYLYYNGGFYRDYIHIDDVVKGIELILDKGELNTIYNLGIGEPILFKDLIDYIVRKTGSKSKINNIDNIEFHNNIQVKSMYLDINKIRKLEFEPKHKIYNILDELIDFYKNEDTHIC